MHRLIATPNGNMQYFLLWLYFSLVATGNNKHALDSLLSPSILNQEKDNALKLCVVFHGDEIAQPFSYLDPSHEIWHMHSKTKK
jgi:hypothetical protein